ncbi:Ig-like domain-containing protein [Leptolyngbyaceae cyanobacterium UHCC 1019]
MPDTAGNSLATATSLKLLSTAQSFQDLVTPAANDFYRFSLANQSSFNLSLTGLDADANVALLDSAGSLVTVNSVEQISNNQGKFSESINTILNPGVYYIQVAPGLNTSIANYTLNVSAADNLIDTDIIWRNYQNGETTVWQLNDALGYTGGYSLLPPSTEPAVWAIRATGDFNRDGQTDILWRYEALGLTLIWFMQDTALASFTLLPATKNGSWTVAGVGDLNDDGSTDILWWNAATEKLDVWLMQGASSVGSIAIAQQQQPGWTARGLGDFNRDGFLDILWHNNSTAASEVWFLKNTTFLSEAALNTSFAKPWYISGVADFNKDGNSDILWRNYGAGGQNQIWLMNGTSLTSTVSLISINSPSWNSTPYSRYGQPNPIDVAGNTIATAFNLGSGLGQSATYRDRVGGQDTSDYYRFDITNTTQVSLLLSNLTGNLDLQLFDSSGNTIVDSSSQSGLSPESIIRSLSAGTYYARVFPALGQAESTYTLSVDISSAPVLVSNNPLTLDEEGSASILSSLLRVTDSDTPDSQLVYTVGNATTNGSLLINGVTATAGTTFTQVNLDDPSQVRYVHNGSETTSDRFSFTVSDGTGSSISNQTFSIQVNPVNDAPILVSNSGLTLSEGDSTVLSPSLLLISDVDSPAVSLQYSITNLPTNGTLLLAGTATSTFTQSDVFNGLVRYQHNGSESPFDRFTFTVTDGAILLPGANTFSISVLPVNDAPAVSINTALTLSEGTSAAITPNLLLVTDPDGPAPVAYTLGSTPANGILKLGTVTLQTGQTFSQLDITNGQLTYIHNGGETTSDRFQFTVTDGLGATSVATTFSISVLAVNDAPVLTAPVTLLVDQNTNTLISGVRLTDADVGDNDVTVSLSAGSGVLTLGRTTGVTFLTGDGTQDSTLSFRGRQDVANFVLESLIYRSTGAFEGTDVVNIAVNDGGNFGLGGVKTDSKNVTLTVAGVNDAPVITAPASQTLSEDVTSPINGINIVDSDAGLSPLTVSLSVVYGALTLGSTAGLTLTTGTGTLNKNLVFSGSQGAINTALAGLTYLSDRNYNGADLLTMNVSDNGFTGNGIPLSASKLITLTINPTNDAPVITVPSSQSVNEGTDLRISGISINDVDVSNGNLTVAVSAVSGVLSLESLTGLTFTTGDGTQDNTLIFQGTQSAVNAALSALTYRPNANFGGTDTIAVSVSDGGNTGTGIPLSDSKSIAVNVLGVNNAPVVALPTGTPAVDSGINLTLSGFSVNDPDAGGGTLSVTLFAENGVLSLRSLSGLQFTQGTGSQNNRITFTGSIAAINDALSQVIYRSYAGFTNAFDRITLSVNDNGNTGVGIPLSDTKTLLVNVGNAVNLLPIATADSFTVAERGTLLGTSVLANDSDPDFTLPLTAQLVSPPTNAGSFSFSPNGTFTYTPVTNFNGFDTFSYVARDVLGGTSNTAIVVINVTSVNDLPVAANDSFTTPEDQPASGNVLANDTDADNPTSSLTAQLISAPTNAGSFSFNPDGSFSYTPLPNFNGIDRFTYVAIDPLGGTSNTAIVSLTITPVNDAPVAANDGVYTASAGGTLSVPSTNGVLRNDSDVEGSALTATLVTAPTNGTVSLNGDGSFIYQPTGNFAGTDVFIYRASDGSLASNLATVTLSVGANNAPIANPNSYTTAEDTLLTTGNVLTNDTDVDGNTPLTASVIAAPANALSFTLNADGSFSYQPKANFNGTDTFVYTATDSLGAVSNPTTVTFSVTPVNDAPVAFNNTVSVVPGGTLNIAAPGILEDDTDVESASLTAVLVSSTSSGTLSLNPNGSFTYRPNIGFSGTDVFTYRANDGSLSSANTATVSIVVDPLANNLPIAQADLFTVAEDTLLTTGNVLTNDTDTDGNIPLTASVIATPTNALAFTLRPDGTFSYQPNPNFSGLDTFTYAAIDSLGAVSSVAIATFNVTPVNDAPVAVNDVYSVNATASLSQTAPGVLANDSDIDSANLTAALISNVQNGTLNLSANGSFTYQPNAGFSGSDRFTYVANDGSLNSTTATVNLFVTTAVNAPPVANPDTFTTAEDTLLNIGNVLTNDTDADGNTPLTASVIAAPANALAFTLNADGSFTYQPKPNITGLDTFTYAAIDSLGAVSSVAIATFSVTPVNDAPTANNDVYNVAPSGSLNITALGVLSNDTDVEGSPLTASLVTAPSSGTFTLNPDGSFTYVPQAGFSGNVSFTYVASDGVSVSNTAIATISVSSNAPPVAAPDLFIGAANTLLTTGNVLANDTDTDGNIPLTASVITTPTNALSFTLRPDGTFSYQPTPNFSGVDTFTYAAIDSLGAVSSVAIATFSIAANAAPVAQNDTYTVNAGSPLNITPLGILSNDTDLEGNTLTASIIGNPLSGSLTLNSNGSFNYTPNPGFFGSDRFTYLANDGQLNSNTATVSLQVNAIPVALSDTYTAVIGASLTIATIDGVLQNDTDADGSPLAASVVVNPTKGTLSLNADGSFIYASTAGSSGVDTFVYQATDGFATSTPTTVTLSLQTNSSPIATNDLYRASTDGTLSVDAFTGVLSNDSDAETSPLALTATLATGAQNGTVTLNSNGSFVYRPNSGYQGLDRFTYRASDGLATSGLATVSLSVSPNTPPAVQNDSYQAASGVEFNQSSILQSVLANDSDAENNLLTASVVSAPGNGTLTLNPNGTFIYTSSTGYQGTDIFTYRAFDGLASSTATVSISVRLNTPPTALPDTYTAIAGQTLNITAPGILVNDTDAEDPISAQPLSQPTQGTLVSFNADGSFVYVPGAGVTTGTDFFTYQVTDGFFNSTPVTVTINVSPLTAVNDTYSVNRDNLINVPRTLGVLANDIAPNSTAAVVSNPTQGSLTLNADGSFAYIPNSGATGADTFTYRATSGGSSSTATVTININATSTPPTVQNDSGYVVSTNGTLNVAVATGVLANDTDADGDVLRATLATAPTNGSVVLNSDGSFRYIPTVGSVGSDTFTYRATDGINLSAPATVVITVGGANAAPVITLPGSQLALRNTDLVIPSGLSISDVDAGSNLVTATLTATNGTLTLGGLSGLTFTTGDGTADTTMTFTGAIAAINTALTNLKFTPTNNFTGAAQIGLVVNDGGFTGTGGAQTGSGTISINVSSGAALVANISPLATSSNPTNLTAVGNLLYFAADDSDTGSELWKSDGSSSATLQVANINPGGSASSPSNFTVVGNTIYFTATNSGTGRELWKTDLAGTSTTLVNDLRLGTLSSNPVGLVNFNNTLFFQANDGSGIAIFKIDSSGNPVKLVASPSYTVPGNLTVVGNTLYFTANGATQLWKTDGTNGNTVLVRDLGSGAQIQRVTAVGNTVFFTAIDSSGTELWRSDGTAANTARVTDLNPGSASSTPNNLMNVNGTLYFFARDAAAFKLWQSNADGTVTLVSTLPSAGQQPTNLTAIGSRLFFTVDAGTAGNPDLQLWSSDGVSTATVVRNINAAGNDTVASLTNFNGSLYFTANDGTGSKVFRTDGTSAGTVAVSGNFSSAPTGLTVVDGKLFFAASDATNGTELWAVQ